MSLSRIIQTPTVFAVSDRLLKYDILSLDAGEWEAAPGDIEPEK